MFSVVFQLQTRVGQTKLFYFKTHTQESVHILLTRDIGLTVNFEKHQMKGKNISVEDCEIDTD